jgi:hypothetical protein
MNSEPVLVDIEKLRKLIVGLDLGDKKWNEYIEARWLNYVEWWDSRSRKAKRKYHGLRCAVIIAGALIPALVALRELKMLETYEWVFAVTAVAASLVVAICAGIDTLYNFGDVWREKRTAAELIKSEGFSFFALTDRYSEFKTHQDAYKLFADNVEKLIRSEIKEYIVAVGPHSQNQTP